MKMVLIDETTLDAKVIDINPMEVDDILKSLMPEMVYSGVAARTIDGHEFLILHDDEFLYHHRNFTGICENSGELLLGSLIVCKDAEVDFRMTDIDNDTGLGGLTDEECEIVMKAWHPISPKLAERYAKDVHPSLLFTMGSNALHYDV